MESPIKSDFPIFKFVYLFIIMAIISVPPLDADKLNKIEEPTAGIKTAQNNSNNLLSVKGVVWGIILLSKRAVKEFSMDT